MNARDYVAGNSHQQHEALIIMDQYLDQMSDLADYRVLDVGCGTGEVTLQMLLPRLTKCRSLLGVDISQEMINFAAASNRDPRVTFRTMDIATREDAVKLIGRRFDKIFSFYCLHWVPDQHRAFENIYKLLEPDGEMLILIVGQHPIFVAYERLMNQKIWAPYMKDVAKMVSPYHHSADPAGDLRFTMENVGLVTIDCQCVNKNYIYTSSQNLKDMIRGVNPFVSRMPASLQTDYLDEMTAVVTGLGRQNEDGSICVSFTNLVALASKPRHEMTQ